MSEQDVRSILVSAPIRYKTFLIEKRSGGERIISQPAREVKFLQRIFAAEVLAKLPIHDAAMAYRTGISIRENATVHASGGAILKFDFKNFFPSIIEADWRHYCKLQQVFESDEDIRLSANLLFTRTKHGSTLRLAIGAPSSPVLSNVLMYKFDSLIAEAVAKDKVKYTRYADDLTFSARRAGNLSGVEQTLRRIITKLSSPRLRINEEKTILATRKYRRVVTGLVLTDDNTISLGRDRKRKIRAMLHNYTLGGLDTTEIARLSGLLAFVNAVEPHFLFRLSEKYGRATIDRIKAILPPASEITRFPSR